MVEWHQFLQSIFIGLIFSYLLSKLISVVVSFKDDNLSISRNSAAPRAGSVDNVSPSRDLSSGDLSRPRDTDSVMAEQGSVRDESLPCSDDDWEGVESTELDDMFTAATAFVAAAASDRLSHKVSTDVQLQLYGLYKIVTEGPCSAPPPSAIKMTARAKWYYINFNFFNLRL
uniref:Acyl-coenzyme A binding domain containing n=1 Tax=Rhizophora mucronata TaxID=61149 RepID=A0A2P2L0W2_RHIMU